ncbi:DNA polymerase beta-like [Cylas formicarius]|uniref:DNA polymerase beta-like n=1 Tax=Cylas formicarius TaxID=197179 RepID=UPI0029589F71|nr:DNA polymerase beta-like [Cylas formicarius]
MSKRKAPGDPKNLNQDFCDFLIELAEHELNVNRNHFKGQVYKNAARVLAAHPTRIKSGEEAKHLKGIGKKIALKIDEYLQTGKLKKLENIHHDDKGNAIKLLTRVSGIGPAKAAKLVDEGITSLEDLHKHPEKLTHHQLIGLKYFEDFEKKIPRNEIEQIESQIKNQLEDIDPKFEVTICGSYRRGKSESGDIDALITHIDYNSSIIDKKHKNQVLKTIVDKLMQCHLITDTLSLGETKFMGTCQLNPSLPTRRLDIRFVPFDQYYCAVLYFTGSDLFNQNMRHHALEQGFTLNEYTLRPLGLTGRSGEPVEILSEKCIFDVIDYPYKSPEERD